MIAYDWYMVYSILYLGLVFGIYKLCAIPPRKVNNIKPPGVVSDSFRCFIILLVFMNCNYPIIRFNNFVFTFFVLVQF